jgi:hypothetical protein
MKFGLEQNAMVSTVENQLTLGAVDQSRIKRLRIVRKNGGTRTMDVAADIAKFIREHASDKLESREAGRLNSVECGVDYKSLTLMLK